ncbi:Nickel uptake substrate-specific transmembrane region [Planctomycetes bacterium CA13]|uniref:Nickel uptake substrate-specific transmembrane region n=1 Tax=Novipirellula herctigrandis TaxID=2527986 RepID=A0A5C5YV11_9BACT|nr:Nickel uptake substrate-specific transmembrane region [Planctomycetes bacterium CA13]
MIRFSLSILLLVCLVPKTGSAHKVWLRPSQTTLSGSEPWVTVDAAVSNDLFFFNHFPLKLDGLQIIAPNGNEVETQNQSVGKYRSVFDLPLTQQGTYRIAVVNHGVFASWEQSGERKRFRGTSESLQHEIPSDATHVQVTESVGRVETFVTNGEPSNESIQPTGKGVELFPLTHPNDLYTGEKSGFRFVVNGKPMQGLEITIIRGGTRYRDTQEEMQFTTDENGEFTVQWTEPGMYWLETRTEDNETKIPDAQTRRLSYAATLEVLPQ